MAERTRLNYDPLATGFDVRYRVDPLTDIFEALEQLADRAGARAILEVGCGTGHWISGFAERGRTAVGIDSSPGMLGEARRKGTGATLVAARANDLPFRPETFDLIYVVNAVHHFDDPGLFIADAVKLLTAGGTMAIVGIDPRLIRRWYLYEYFETRQRDLQRFPSFGALVDAMLFSGFDIDSVRIVSSRCAEFRGQAVLDDPFLNKASNSQLALLTDAQYRQGLDRIRREVADSEAEGEQAVFRSELDFWMLAGHKRRV